MISLSNKISTVISSYYGSFTTFLELEYEKHIINNLIEGDTLKRTYWATYNQVILEFKFNVGDQRSVQELQYRLTNKENPNLVCMEVIKKYGFSTSELDRLYHKINNF